MYGDPSTSSSAAGVHSCVHGSRGSVAKSVRRLWLSTQPTQQDAQGDHLLHLTHGRLGAGQPVPGRGRDQGEARCGHDCQPQGCDLLHRRQRGRRQDGQAPLLPRVRRATRGPPRAPHTARAIFQHRTRRARAATSSSTAATAAARRARTPRRRRRTRPRSPAALRGRPLWSAERACGARRAASPRAVVNPGNMRPLGERLARAGRAAEELPGPSAHGCGVARALVKCRDWFQNSPVL